jgi:mannose-1-phosphate guanylyltransferase/mannose-1-phosphate guanylyltransferase/mannose-6-phosphate isomerase
MTLVPIVLSGGSGTRLWPLSRRGFPKQFHQLLEESLLAKTLRRVSPLGSPWIVGVAGTEALTRRVLEETGLRAERTVFEPVGRNTAPAVALVIHLLEQQGRGEEVVGIFPADHLIGDEEALRRAVELAAVCARRGKVATLGIRPTFPATGYGYIEVSREVVAEGIAEGVTVPEGEPPLAARVGRGFREKPDPATAERFLEAGDFFWNAGMFVFRVADMAGCFERWMPELWRRVAAVEADLSNLAEVYEHLPGESFDVGIMEHLGEEVLVSIPCDPEWSDLGSWDEVARRAPGSSEVFEVDAGGNFVLGHRGKVYGLVGVEDLVVVDTADATLVAKKGTTQKVKELVAALRRAGRPEADEHPFEVRPWGEFEILRDTERFKSKILRVAPGRQLSYQSHRYRSEHWVIVQGRPEVVLDGEVLRPEPGEAVYIPQGARHRIRNPTEETVEIVEVQLGSYFGEDDILRYEDDFGRV